MRPRRGGKDLSKVAGNPTHGLEQAYQELMSITNPEELKQRALEIVEPYVGQGMSENNFARFQRTLMGQRNLAGIQKYLTNFLLSGSNLGVEDNQIKSIASLISEDIDVAQPLTERQQRLKILVESYGYNVVLLR